MIYTPQALHFKKYSTASDVWSFGAVMYEIWSLGHKPFEGYTNAQVHVHYITSYVAVPIYSSTYSTHTHTHTGPEDG